MSFTAFLCRLFSDHYPERNATDKADHDAGRAYAIRAIDGPGSPAPEHRYFHRTAPSILLATLEEGRVRAGDSPWTRGAIAATKERIAR